MSEVMSSRVWSSHFLWETSLGYTEQRPTEQMQNMNMYLLAGLS